MNPPSERQLQYWKRRATLAEQEVLQERRYNETTRQWALNAFEEERRLARRCEFLYGAARSHGASVDELRDVPSTGAAA